MREILFRGKHVDDGKWIMGYFINFPNSKPEICFEYDEDWESNYCEYVIPETVGQYTGLTDKNGRKIFEGDIITAEPDKSVIAVVKYNESKAAFYVEDENAEDYLGEAWDTDVVVIGNVFDNNELLKGE